MPPRPTSARGLAGERRAAGIRLDVADAAAAAARPVERHGHVAELAGQAVGAVQELAAGDDRAADARSRRSGR